MSTGLVSDLMPHIPGIVPVKTTKTTIYFEIDTMYVMFDTNLLTMNLINDRLLKYALLIPSA